MVHEQSTGVLRFRYLVRISRYYRALFAESLPKQLPGWYRCTESRRVLVYPKWLAWPKATGIHCFDCTHAATCFIQKLHETLKGLSILEELVLQRTQEHSWSLNIRSNVLYSWCLTDRPLTVILLLRTALRHCRHRSHSPVRPRFTHPKRRSVLRRYGL